MKKIILIFFLFWTVCSLFGVAQSANYNHPSLNVNHVPMQHLSKLHWVSREEIVNNSSGKQIAFLKGETMLTASGKRMGKVAKNVIYYEADGVAELLPSQVPPCKQTSSGAIGMSRSYKNQFGVHCE